MKFKTSDAKNDPSLRVYENIKEPPGDGSVFEIFYPWLMESLTGNVFYSMGLKGAQWLSQ